MLNYTVRLVIWPHKEDKQGRCPIVIALTISRKMTFFATPYKVEKKYWNNETKETVAPLPNFKSINADLRKRVSDIEHALLNKTIEGRPIDGAMLKRELKGISETKNFISFAEALRRDREGDNAEGSLTNYTKEINRLKAFAGAYIPLNQIDSKFLRKYEASERKRGQAQNTLNTTFRWIHTVITVAKKDGLIKDDPFNDYTIPKYVQSDRIFLEKHERDAWIKYWESGKVTGTLYNTLTYFLLGVFSGLRHSDWGSATSRVFGDILRLRPQKTHKSGQWVVLPIGPTLAKILEVVKTLPPPISGDKTREHLKILAGRMETTKNITTHVARHSFAAMCAENKIPKSVTAELMGVTVDTVEIYYHLTGSNIAEQAAVLRSI